MSVVTWVAVGLDVAAAAVLVKTTLILRTASKDLKHAHELRARREERESARKN